MLLNAVGAIERPDDAIDKFLRPHSLWYALRILSYSQPSPDVTETDTAAEEHARDPGGNANALNRNEAIFPKGSERLRCRGIRRRNHAGINEQKHSCSQDTNETRHGKASQCTINQVP